MRPLHPHDSSRGHCQTLRGVSALEHLPELNRETCQLILKRNQALLDEYMQLKKASILDDLDALRQV